MSFGENNDRWVELGGAGMVDPTSLKQWVTIQKFTPVSRSGLGLNAWQCVATA